eukprot:1143495-Pelagomonas_calceolata.AAC.5
MVQKEASVCLEPHVCTCIAKKGNAQGLHPLDCPRYYTLMSVLEPVLELYAHIRTRACLQRAHPEFLAKLRLQSCLG